MKRIIVTLFPTHFHNIKTKNDLRWSARSFLKAAHKAQRYNNYSPSYKIADCELSNSYLLTHKIFSSNRLFYNLVKRVELYYGFYRGVLSSKPLLDFWWTVQGAHDEMVRILP